MSFKVIEFTDRKAMLAWFESRSKTCNITTLFHQIVKTDSGYEVFYQDFY